MSNSAPSDGWRERPLTYYILMLTWRCTAACPHCCWACHPNRVGLMGVDDAIEYLRQAEALSMKPRSVNFSGGEVGLCYDHLVTILERAASENLRGPYRVETNGFYCTGMDVAIEKFRRLRSLNVRGLDLTQDPYHLPYVPFESMKIALEAARHVFGPSEIHHYSKADELVAYHAEHGTLDGCPAADTRRYARTAGALYVGRAARCIAPLRAAIRPEDLPDGCLDREAGWTLDPRWTNQISILPEGVVTPGACTGMVIGDTRQKSVEAILTQPLVERHPLIRMLIEQGPRALIPEFLEAGGQLREHYASVCHLCWDVRSWLQSRYPAILAPGHLYEDEPHWQRRGIELVGWGGEGQAYS